MARFDRDPNRVNFTTAQVGHEYNLRLLQRAQPIFTTLLNLLASNYISAVSGPNYTNELKAVAVELARLELALEDVDYDRTIATTRPEFLYSIIGYFLFLNGSIPNLTWNDDQFRSVLLNLIRIYFQGSIPQSMGDVAKLFIDGTVLVKENFLLIRKGASGLDISDQFGFDLDVVIPLGGGFPPDVLASDKALRQVLDVVRPAHTLYRIRYIFQDKYIPNDPSGKILDSMRWHMSSYYYDDFRKYCQGIRDRDRLGVKTNHAIVNENHSNDF